MTSAYGVDALDVGFHHVVHRDEAAVNLDAHCLQADSIDVALYSDGHQYRIAVQDGALSPGEDGHLGGSVVYRDSLDLRAGGYLYPLPSE